MVGQLRRNRYILFHCLSGKVIGVILLLCHNLILKCQQNLVNEVSKTPGAALRDDMEALLGLAHQNVSVGASEQTRCTQLKSLGFKWLDALHIACAESSGTDILLTTDDRMLRRAKRFHSQLRVRVENPYTWLEELAENEHTRSARS